MVDYVPLTGLISGDQNTTLAANQIFITGGGGTVTTSGTNLTINPNGNIGIGTGSASYAFSVYATDTVLFNNRPRAGNRSEIQIGNTAAYGAIIGYDPDMGTSFGYLRRADTAASYSAISWTNNSVGIGNVGMPATTLDVNGAATLRVVNSISSAPSHLSFNNNGGTATVIGWQFTSGIVATSRVDNTGNVYQNSNTNNFFFNPDTAANAAAGTANFYTNTAFMNVVGNSVVFPGSVAFSTGSVSLSNIAFTGSNISSNTGSININGLLNSQGITETVNIQTAIPAAVINLDFLTSSILYYSAAPSSNMTLNLRGNSTVALNTVMSIGQSINCTAMITNTSGTWYITALTIDSFSVTPKWIGAQSPTTGFSSGIDVYSFAVVKTGNNTYQVLATQAHYG
jgi:hypothetical protein